MSGLKLLEKAKQYVEDDSATNFGTRETMNITARFKDYDGKYLTEKDIDMYFGVSDGLRYANTLKLDIMDFPDTKKLVEIVNKFPYLETLTLGSESGGIYGFLPDNFHYHELFNRPGLKHLEIEFLRLERDFRLKTRINTITLTSLKLFLKHYNPFIDEILANMGNLKKLEMTTVNTKSRKPVNVTFGKYIEDVILDVGNLNFLNTSETLRSLDISHSAMSGKIEPFKRLMYFHSDVIDIENFKKYIPYDLPKLGLSAERITNQQIIDEIDEAFPNCILETDDIINGEFYKGKFMHSEQKLIIRKHVVVNQGRIYGDRYLTGASYEGALTINFQKERGFSLFLDESQKKQITLTGNFVKIEESEKHYRFADDSDTEIDYHYLVKSELKKIKAKNITIKNCPKKLDLEFSGILKGLTIEGENTEIDLNKKDFPSLIVFSGKGVILRVDMDLHRLKLEKSTLLKSSGKYDYFSCEESSIRKLQRVTKIISMENSEFEEEMTLELEPSLEEIVLRHLDGGKLKLEARKNNHLQSPGNPGSHDLKNLRILRISLCNKVYCDLDLQDIDINDMDLTIHACDNVKINFGNQIILLDRDKNIRLEAKNISGNFGIPLGVRSNLSNQKNKKILINSPNISGAIKFHNADIPIIVDSLGDLTYYDLWFRFDEKKQITDVAKSRKGETINFSGKLFIQKDPFIILF